MKKMLMVALIALMAVMNMGCTDNDKTWELVQAEYTVEKGDTLDKIAWLFMEKNTYGRRGLVEFEEGIRELNDLEYGEEVKPGMKLKINYWVKKEVKNGCTKP